MISMGEVSLPETIKMITTTPARILGVADRKGELVAGKDGDIVLFNKDIHVSLTIIKGKIVYRREL
jgi:N-acetylglucosamine-6-phosphate deacetylase